MIIVNGIMREDNRIYLWQYNIKYLINYYLLRLIIGFIFVPILWYFHIAFAIVAFIPLLIESWWHKKIEVLAYIEINDECLSVMTLTEKFSFNTSALLGVRFNSNKLHILSERFNGELPIKFTKKQIKELEVMLNESGLSR